MRTTAIFSYKGGTGKTTTAINLAAELTQRGKNVLLIDADGQRNTTDFFGVDAEIGAGTIYDLLTSPDPYYENYVLPTRYVNLYLLPSNTDLATVELQAMRRAADIHINALRDLCEAVAEDGAFDFTLIDCPPSFAPQSVAALLAADDVIVPVTLDQFAVSGLRDLTISINGARQSNARLRIAGVLATMFDRSAVARDALLGLRQSGYPVFETVIRDSALYARMTFAREPLCVRFPGTNPMWDYVQLCDEYLTGGSNHE